MSHELAERTTGGVLVRLLWSSAEDAVRIEYFDLRTGDAFCAPVPKAEALTAFEHPNAYRPLAAASTPGPREGSAEECPSIWDSCHRTGAA